MRAYNYCTGIHLLLLFYHILMSVGKVLAIVRGRMYLVLHHPPHDCWVTGNHSGVCGGTWASTARPDLRCIRKQPVIR